MGRECAALRAIPEKTTPGWLYAWTLSQDFLTQVARGVTGATMQRLSVRELPEFTVPLPSLGQQREMDALFDRFHHAIQSTTRALSQLRELEHAEINLAFARIGAKQE